MDAPPDLVVLLRSLEEDLLRPTVRHSRAELEARLTPDFVEVGGSRRVCDRTAIAAGGRQSVILRSSIWRRDGATRQMAFHQGAPSN